MATTKNISGAIWRMNETLTAINDALIENGGELTEEIENELNAANLTAAQIADGLHAVITCNKTQSEAIAAEIKRLQALKKARENAVEGIKRYLLNSMQLHGISKIDGEYCRVSIAAGRESVESDDEAIVNDYMGVIAQFAETLPNYLSIDVKVNKTALKEAIINGEPVRAALVKNPYLLIR